MKIDNILLDKLTAEVPVHRHQKTSEGTVILEMKDAPYEPIQECDVLK